jgi:2,3-bisphosphoglycerate-independent phosphoglycerate mutase
MLLSKLRDNKMMDLEFLRKYILPAKTKIVLLVMDGLGGLPRHAGGKTELETARTPNLDQLASQAACGLTIPVAPGLTVGSGPGHLALFGYDPIENEIGRGAMEAMGIDFELGDQDVAARGNFCTVDQEGKIIDRRAGRLPTEQARQLAGMLSGIQMDGVEFFILPVKEHRFGFVFRGPGLGDALTGSDPLSRGGFPLEITASHPDSIRTAQIANWYIGEARKLLAGKHPANMITLRGFSRLPSLPKFADLYKLNAAAIAIQGMYRGVARMAGMTLLPIEGTSIADEFSTLEKHWQEFDFFYLHIKKTDICGEMGDFDGKVKVIEEVDAQISRLTALNPDVIIVAGDHSTPAVMCAHSWHPVPVLVWSKLARGDGIDKFGERACQNGSLGILPARSLMALALANAGRIEKYGA